MGQPPAADFLGDMFQRLVGEQRHHQGVQRPLKIGVAGCLPQQAVEFQVQCGGFQQGAVPGIHLGHQLFQLGGDLGGDAGAGQAQRLGLQDDAQGADLQHFLRPDIGDEHAAALAVLHQALLLQLGQRLAHRNAADVQLARDLAFVQPVARLVLAGQDVGRQHAHDMGAQGGRRVAAAGGGCHFGVKLFHELSPLGPSTAVHRR